MAHVVFFPTLKKRGPYNVGMFSLCKLTARRMSGQMTEAAASASGRPSCPKAQGIYQAEEGSANHPLPGSSGAQNGLRTGMMIFTKEEGCGQGEERRPRRMGCCRGNVFPSTAARSPDPLCPQKPSPGLGPGSSATMEPLFYFLAFFLPGIRSLATAWSP